MTDKYWQIIPHQSSDHWLQLWSPDGWWRAYVKPDGCVGLNRYHNTAVSLEEASESLNIKIEHPRLVDHLHICELDDTISRLESIEKLAQKRFGPDWPY